MKDFNSAFCVCEWKGLNLKKNEKSCESFIACFHAKTRSVWDRQKPWEATYYKDVT